MIRLISQEIPSQLRHLVAFLVKADDSQTTKRLFLKKAMNGNTVLQSKKLNQVKSFIFLFFLINNVHCL